MQPRHILLRAPVGLRLLQQRSFPNSFVLARHESYQSSVNPQPPLTKTFSAEDVVDLDKAVNSGGPFPYGPVHPKVRALQEFYQTPNGRPIWMKTKFDEFLYRTTVVMVTISTLWAMYILYGFTQPKKAKKIG